MRPDANVDELVDEEVSLAAEADAALEEAAQPTVPYMSAKGLLNLLDKLQQDTIPSAFDRSFFGAQSGSLVAQVRVTFKFFGFIDEARRPTGFLREVVAADADGRKALLRQVIEPAYADVIELAHANGTAGQLQELFRQRGLSGGTVQKGIAFYFGMAEYLDLPMSPYFKRGRASGGTNGGTRRVVRRRKATETPKSPPPSPTPRQDTSLAGKKAAYIDMLMAIAQKSAENGEVQAELLDRIERALGYPDEAGVGPD